MSYLVRKYLKYYFRIGLCLLPFNVTYRFPGLFWSLFAYRNSIRPIFVHFDPFNRFTTYMLISTVMTHFISFLFLVLVHFRLLHLGHFHHHFYFESFAHLRPLFPMFLWSFSIYSILSKTIKACFYREHTERKLKQIKRLWKVSFSKICSNLLLWILSSSRTKIDPQGAARRNNFVAKQLCWPPSVYHT